MGTGRLDLPRARILEVLGKQDDVARFRWSLPQNTSCG